MGARIRGAAVGVFAVTLACQDYDVARIVTQETFTQNDGNLSVDFLWVMDDSGTMSEEQEEVVAGLGAFVGVLEGFGADWQVAVITTGVQGETAGHFVAGVLSSLDGRVEEAFAAALEVGTNGGVSEQGLEAMRLATSEAMLSSANAGFLREDAGLSVVVVSDEDDQSPDEVSAYRAHLDDLKGQGVARVSAVVGDLPAGCATPQAAANPGTRYREISTGTGGYQDSICRQDFTDTMKALSLNGLGLTDTFVLSRVPEPDTIEVQVDGVQIWRRPENGWQYEAGKNAIVFDGYGVPGPGAKVSVRYHAWLGSADTG